MLPNIDRNLYARFKREGYRIKKFQEEPVQTLDDIVHLGYQDVCRRMGGIDKQQCQAFKQPVASFIVRLLARRPETQEAFDRLHRRCCQECAAGWHGKSRVQYGQAQKLLNMSLKYLYNEFAVYYGTLNRFRFPDNNVEWFFHLPIDIQIRTHLVDHCGFADPTSSPWSNWSYDDYWNFQSQLRNRISSGYKPLEIDYMLWNTNGVTGGDAITPLRR